MLVEHHFFLFQPVIVDRRPLPIRFRILLVPGVNSLSRTTQVNRVAMIL